MYIPLLLVAYENAYLPTPWMTNKYAFPCLSNGSIGEHRFLCVLMLWPWSLGWCFHAFIDRLSYHFQFLSEGTYGSFPTGYQFFQILIPQFLSGPALSCTLPAPLEFGLQVNFGWLPTTFARLLHFASNHLQHEREEIIFFVLVLCLGKWLWLHTSMENIYK